MDVVVRTLSLVFTLFPRTDKVGKKMNISEEFQHSNDLGNALCGLNTTESRRLSESGTHDENLITRRCNPVQIPPTLNITPFHPPSFPQLHSSLPINQTSSNKIQQS